MTEWSSYIPAVITASAAFLGAMLAQYVAHRLAIHRESITAQFAAYEKLFAPVAADVMAYLDAYWCPTYDALKPEFTGEHLEVLRKRVTEHIWNNLSYARGKLLSVMMKQTAMRVYGEAVGLPYRMKRETAACFHAFMVEYHRTVCSIYPQHNFDRLYRYRFRFRLLEALYSMEEIADYTHELILPLDLLGGKLDPKAVRQFEKRTDQYLKAIEATPVDALWKYLYDEIFSLDPVVKETADQVWAKRHMKRHMIGPAT